MNNLYTRIKISIQCLLQLPHGMLHRSESVVRCTTRYMQLHVWYVMLHTFASFRYLISKAIELKNQITMTRVPIHFSNVAYYMLRMTISWLFRWHWFCTHLLRESICVQHLSFYCNEVYIEFVVGVKVLWWHHKKC